MGFRPGLRSGPRPNPSWPWRAPLAPPPFLSISFCFPRSNLLSLSSTSLPPPCPMCNLVDGYRRLLDPKVSSPPLSSPSLHFLLPCVPPLPPPLGVRSLASPTSAPSPRARGPGLPCVRPQPPGKAAPGPCPRRRGAPAPRGSARLASPVPARAAPACATFKFQFN
jgi:hypothetical protein